MKLYALEYVREDDNGWYQREAIAFAMDVEKLRALVPPSLGGNHWLVHKDDKGWFETKTGEDAPYYQIKEVSLVV